MFGICKFLTLWTYKIR